MIVDDFNILRSNGVFWPFKADPPLFVDSDGKLTLPAAFQAFQPIARQLSQVGQTSCGIKNFKSLVALNAERFELSDSFSTGKGLGLLVAITLNHIDSLP